MTIIEIVITAVIVACFFVIWLLNIIEARRDNQVDEANRAYYLLRRNFEDEEPVTKENSHD